jgi:hypothetical protein
VLATAFGAFVAWLLGMLPSTMMSLGPDTANALPSEISDTMINLLALGRSLVLGPILGLPQWWVLRRHLSRAGWWIGANALAWAAGMPIIFIGIGLVAESEISIGLALGTLALTLTIAGAAVSVIHGFFLVWLIRRRQID